MVTQQEQARRPEARRIASVGIALCTLLAAAPALAHDFWIEPDRFRPRAGDVVTVRLKVGERFEGDPVPRSDALIERFALVTEGGETPVVGRDAAEPAGRVRAAAPGPAVLAYRSRTTPLELDARKFETHLAEEGLESIIEARARRGDSAKPGKEIFSRCAKSLLAIGPPAGADAAPPAVGAGAASPGPRTRTSSGATGKGRLPLYRRPLGLTLEIVPEADPYDLKPGARFPVRVLHEGRPLGSVLVVAMNAEDPAKRVSARSDKAGRASLVLERPGFWLVKAVHARPAPKVSDADWESLWASLTFEVPGGTDPP